MNTRAPKDYICPICIGNQGIENDDTLLKQADLIFRDDLVSVWMNSFWIRGNEGHVIIVPNEHFENVYSVPDVVGHRIFEISKVMSKTLKAAYSCDGITLRQNNEPAGDQHALHYHLHVFPRYDNDTFNQELTRKSYVSDPEKRRAFVDKIKQHPESPYE